MKPVFYIQSRMPANGYLVHHSPYAGLKGIVQTGEIKESRPYKGISFSSVVGGFLNPLSNIGVQIFGATVDGFITVPAADLIEQNLVVPCLYRTSDEDLVNAADKAGHKIFGEAYPLIPPEYKYIIPYVVHGEMFVDENEWMHFGPRLILPHGSECWVRTRYLKLIQKVHPGFYTMPIREMRIYGKNSGTSS